MQDPDSQIPGRSKPPKPYRVNAVDQLLQIVQRDIRSLMNQITDELATGLAKDYAEYKYSAGLISGLAHAERILLDIDERVAKSEEE